MEVKIFTTEGLTKGSNSGPLDPKFDALITWPRIHQSSIFHFGVRHNLLEDILKIDFSLLDKISSQRKCC